VENGQNRLLSALISNLGGKAEGVATVRKRFIHGYQ
jgi:hypothetical protein